MPSKESQAPSPTEPDAKSTSPLEPVTSSPASSRPRWRRPLIILVAIVFVLVIIPKIYHAWHTVSTDDAYVNSYVTFVETVCHA
jgi:multidrug resistance efflux pump